MLNTVFITTSGNGERLGDLTKYTNKSLVGVGDKYAICYIIDNYDTNTEFIITLGYYGNYVREFLLLSYPLHNFTFININKYSGLGSSLGYSMLSSKSHLQKPFMFHCCDSITINKKIDFPLNQTTLYVYPLNSSVHYTNVKVDNDIVTEINKKNHLEYDFVYTGISYIYNYVEFWKNLEYIYNLNILNNELSDVDVFHIMIKNNIKIKYIILENWYDTGNIESYNNLNNVIKSKYNILYKNYESLCFFKDKVIKFINDKNINEKRVIRYNSLYPLTPKILGYSDNFICMELIEGQLMSETTNYNDIYNLLCWAKQYLWITQNTKIEYIDCCKQFYINKTIGRINQLLFLTDEKHIINNLKCMPIFELLKSIPEKYIINDTFNNFHGDFILDNIIKTNKLDKGLYKLIDLRHEFDNQLHYGDIYYDLAKLRHNIIFNHSNIKQQLFTLNKNNNEITFDLKCNFMLITQLDDFDKFVLENNYNLNKVKIITSIIWLNMSPLYKDKLGEFLFYFGKYNLQVILTKINNEIGLD